MSTRKPPNPPQTEHNDGRADEDAIYDLILWGLRIALGILSLWTVHNVSLLLSLHS